MRSITRAGRRRIGVAVACVVSAVLGLTGCASSSASTVNHAEQGFTIPSKDPKATVTVLSDLDLKTDGMQSAVDAFEQAHPNITVKWEAVPFGSLDSTVESHVANKGGDPDVYWADQPRISALAARGEAQDLTPEFSKYRSAFKRSSYDIGKYEGKLYALPIEDSTQLLFYNRDLIGKAGLQAPSSNPTKPITWQTLAADALKAKRAGAQYGMTFGQFDRYYQLEPLSVQLGGSAGATGKDKLTPDITSAAWVKGMRWYRSIFTSGASPRGMTADQTDQAFESGRVAYTVEGPWIIDALQKAGVNWGVAPMPAFAGTKNVATPTGSWSVAMNPFSKEKAAAAVFMKWLAVDGGAGYTRYYANASLPANIAGAKYYYDRPVFHTEAGEDAKAIIEYQSEHTAYGRLKSIGYIEFETILDQTYSDIRNGADPKQALQSAKIQLQSAWQKYL